MNFWPVIVTVLFYVSGQSEDMIIETTKDITAVLGEDVYLSCRYLGDTKIKKAVWKRQITKTKSRGVTGISTEKSFGSSDFSEPDSLTNLTVKMSVSRVDLEGEYICEFETEEEETFSESTYVTIIGKLSQQYYCFLLFITMWSNWPRDEINQDFKGDNLCTTSLILIKPTEIVQQAKISHRIC